MDLRPLWLFSRSCRKDPRMADFNHSLLIITFPISACRSASFKLCDVYERSVQAQGPEARFDFSVLDVVMIWLHYILKRRSGCVHIHSVTRAVCSDMHATPVIQRCCACLSCNWSSSPAYFSGCNRAALLTPQPRK